MIRERLHKEQGVREEYSPVKGRKRRVQHKQKTKKTKSARYLIQTFFMEGKIETLPEVLTNKELTTLGKIILPWKFLSGK